MNVDIGTVIALGTDAVARKLLAFPLVPQVEVVSVLACVTALAKTADVVLADEMPETRALPRWNIMTVWTERTTGAATGLEVGADGTADLRRLTELWEELLEVVVESKSRSWDGLGLKDLRGKRR